MGSRSRSRSGSREDSRSPRPDERRMVTIEEAGNDDEDTKMREDHKDSDDGAFGI